MTETRESFFQLTFKNLGICCWFRGQDKLHSQDLLCISYCRTFCERRLAQGGVGCSSEGGATATGQGVVDK